MKSSFVITSYFFCLCVLQISAQDMKNLGALHGFLNSDYHWTIELPLWVPGYTSEYSYGDENSDDGGGTEPGVPTHPIEKPEVGNLFSRLFSSNSYLKYFWGLKAVYKRDRLLAQVDVKAGVIGNDLKYNVNDTKIADADLSMSFTRAFLGYAIIDNLSKSNKSKFSLFGCIGLNFNRIELASPIGGSAVDIGIDYDWTSVVVGLQGQYILTNWLFILHTDFGVSTSIESYSLVFEGFCHYRLSRIFSIKLGWIDRHAFQDTEVFNEKFTGNVYLSGPVIGIMFHF